MRADIAVIICKSTAELEERAGAIRRWLRNFGITAEVLAATSVGAGKRGKGFLRAHYRAAIYLENRLASDTDTSFNEGWSWINYSFGDIPIGYFGPILTGANGVLPADFPIVPFNYENANTYYQFPHFIRFEADTPKGRQLGTRMRFSDGRGAWGRTVNYVWVGSRRTGTFRVFPNRLDVKREVVLRPDWQEMGFMPSRPEEIATGVRYYNRYFLPCLSFNGIGLPNPYTDGAAPGDTFCPGLVLWFLEQAGVLPRWKMPVTYDIDHPLPGLESAQGSGMNLQQIRYVDRCTMEWVLDFARRLGLIIQCGVLTGGRWRSAQNQHWYYRNQTPNAEALHRLLLDEHRRTFPCCWHDHTFPIGRTGDYRRHVGGYYGAPAAKPGFDWNYEGHSVESGTGVRNSSFRLTTRDAYRIHWEGSLMEMQGMGFPDIACCEQNYLNMAGNEWGNLRFLDFLMDETSVRALRITSTSRLQEGERNPFTRADYQLLKYRQIELFETEGLDSGMRGLFNPGEGTGLNDSDVNQRHRLGVLETDSNRERKVRARYLALHADWAIRHHLYLNGILMTHGDFCHAANPQDPLADFRSTGNWNGMKEIFTAIGEWYNLLDKWLQPGGVQDIIRWREKMRG
jgi:hypothetical protein